MKNWLRVDTDFVDHPKVRRLASVTGNQQAGWYVLRLWSWLSRFSPEGHFEDHEGDMIESAVEWSGAPGVLLAALIKCRFIDKLEESGFYEAHDWDEFQGKVAEQRRKEREKKAKWRAAKKAQREAEMSTGTSTASPALRNVTGRDVTLRVSNPSPLSQSEPPTPHVEGSKKQRVPKEKLPDDRQRQPTSPEEDLKSLQEAAAGGFSVWASNQHPTPGPAGETATAWLLGRFQRYSHDPASIQKTTLHLKLAWSDFADWCQQEGLKPGWGLFIREEVGEYRLNQARAGELPRPKAAAARPGGQSAAGTMT